jgi:hypothetical protein
VGDGRRVADHAAIAGNVIALLNAALGGRPCRVHTEALRVRVKETGLATYPDASVVCDRLELDCALPVAEICRDPLGG